MTTSYEIIKIPKSSYSYNYKIKKRIFGFIPMYITDNVMDTDTPLAVLLYFFNIVFIVVGIGVFLIHGAFSFYEFIALPIWYLTRNLHIRNFSSESDAAYYIENKIKMGFKKEEVVTRYIKKGNSIEIIKSLN